MAAVVATVMVEDPPVVTEVGLNDAVAPAGRPAAENVSGSVPPETTAVESVVLAEEPATTEAEAGVAATDATFSGAVQPGSVNDPMRVFQLKEPLAPRYSCENQNVQSSVGSTLIDE